MLLLTAGLPDMWLYQHATSVEPTCRPALRPLLLSILEVNAIVLTIAKQTLEARLVEWRRDNQNIPNPRQQQRTDGIIHHRLVVDGQQLFAYTFCNRVKPRAGAPGENYSFHC